MVPGPLGSRMERDTQGGPLVCGAEGRYDPGPGCYVQHCYTGHVRSHRAVDPRVFPYIDLLLVRRLLRCFGLWPYLQTMLGLAALGGLSHVALDLMAHGTPLFYPLTMLGAGPPPPTDTGITRVWNYIRRPVSLLEGLMLAVFLWRMAAGPSGKRPTLSRGGFKNHSSACNRLK